MLNRIALLVAITSIGLAAVADSADAARSSARGSLVANSHARAMPGRHFVPGNRSFTPRHATTVPGRHGGLGLRSLTPRAANGKTACGTWVCTWRTSDGGCLVWEKTACKIKIIYPF